MRSRYGNVWFACFCVNEVCSSPAIDQLLNIDGRVFAITAYVAYNRVEMNEIEQMFNIEEKKVSIEVIYVQRITDRQSEEFAYGFVVQGYTL